MTHSDLSIIYCTANVISEYFMKNMQKQLLIAVGDTPIVSVSFKPTVVGNNCVNICIGEQKRSAYMIYKQVLMAALAATTEFVSIAEDDVLYPVEHFQYRPHGEVFAYDINKWAIYTWTRPPIFSQKQRVNMTGLIVRREPLIKTLEERFAKYPDPDHIPVEIFGEPGRFEEHLGITGLIKERIETPIPHIMFSAPESLGFAHLGTRKAHSGVRCTELPGWGTASEILKLYNRNI